MKWVRVTRRAPCPICAKPDYCGVTEDGTLAHCMRVESDRPCRSAKSGGWFHKLGESVTYVPPPKPKTKPVATEDFAPLAEQCQAALTNINLLAKDLGLSVESLRRLEVGWSSTYHGYTFPMRDGHGKVIGIRVRGQKAKWCVPGSHNGLFWPQGVSRQGSGLLLLPEGPTSCGACLDLGYEAIGRPNCELGATDIQAILRQARRDVVIVADHDEPHERPDGSVYYPGQQGAAKITEQIKPLCRTLKVVKPPFTKDIRDWLHEGATREIVDCVIKSTRFV